MANYYASARTNYFHVKDETKFKEWASKRICEVVTSESYPGAFALLPGDFNDGAFINYDGETDDEIDFMDELSEHLADGSVAVLMEAGAEKLRYINGYAQAINNKGKFVELSLNDIYDKAKNLGSEILPCEY